MALLELKNLTVRFGGLTAVNDVSCTVEAGQIYSIIGPNGAGKTTVFNAITGIYNPSSGRIDFNGSELRRPWTRLVLAGCILAGVLTGLGAVLAAVNVDRLWRATIKRNYADTNTPFSYSEAWQDFKRYFRGDLTLEWQRGDRWSIVASDGSMRLLSKLPLEEAQGAVERLRALRDAAARNPDAIARQVKRLMSIDAQGNTVSQEFETESAAMIAAEQLNLLSHKAATLQTKIWLSFVGGMLAGMAGLLVVWNRSRRTPDFIARSGLTRTFQNIRLFRTMTVQENVLTAMDRQIHAGVFSLGLGLPRARREEQQAHLRAMELLALVELQDKAGVLAQDLSYGDQRRLEIGRALATEPKLILLDEPAAGMNSNETMQLVDLIRRIRERGISVLLIEHHMKLVMGISDRIAVLDHGVKIAEGTPEEIRTSPEVIEAYLGSEEVG